MSLTIDEIEAAGLKEILQAPGTLTSWAIFDELLAPTGINTPFIFKEPLGQSREVKVALSGLFGRFVARAYLSKHFNLRLFTHLSAGTKVLDGIRRSRIVKSGRGDYPDWVACDANLKSLTIAEAKGCHNPKSPAAALKRAFKQAQRVTIEIGGRRAKLKHIAIATRWGFQNGGPREPIVAVQDPDSPGDGVSEEEMEATAVGIARLDSANLLARLGHSALAHALRELATARFARQIEAQRVVARAAIENTKVGSPTLTADLVGGVVTRYIPIGDIDLTESDQALLHRLNLRQVFVGVERVLLDALIEGSADGIRAALSISDERSDSEMTIRAGTWIIRQLPISSLDEDDTAG